MDFIGGIVRGLTAPPGDIIEGRGFYISYRLNETALVNTPKSGRGKMLILHGDHRAAYRPKIDDGWRACLAVYRKLKASHRSEWSEDKQKGRPCEAALLENFT